MQPVEELPVFYRRFIARLRFRRATVFHFYHGGKLYGLLSRVIGRHPLGAEFIITPCESGRINYAAGDEYVFGITLLKNDAVLAEKLREGLQNIPDTGYPGDLTAATVELAGFTEIPPDDAACPFPPDGMYHLSFYTPLRVERRKEDAPKGKRYFDPGFFDLPHFLQLLYKRLQSLRELNGLPVEKEMPCLPEITVIDQYFLWIDMPKDNSTLGGMQGYVRFSMPPDPVWHHVICAGQYANTGKNTSFGFGAYTVNGSAVFGGQLQPARTLLQEICTPANLTAAFYHISENSQAPGADGITPAIYEENLSGNLEKLRESVLAGQHRAENLLGILLPKPGNKIRALAIPTVRERVLQRAVAAGLYNAVDHLLEESSFAYRKGFSRQGAARAIAAAKNKGMAVVLESDIRSFFDMVNWDLMAKKLAILFGDDPVTALLNAWVQAKVEFRGSTITRERGLPQGAPVSPLLANLYLDEFDDEIGGDYKLVRYADDFVVLCKSKQEAEQALERVIDTYSLEKQYAACTGNDIDEAGESVRQYVVIYEVTEAAMSGQIEKLLAGYGRMVQNAVYECTLTGRQHAALTEALAPLKKDGVTIRVYPVSVTETGAVPTQ